MNLAFSMTTPQMRARTKFVTRRLGKGPSPGQRFWAIVKGQGLKKGEKVERICELECVSNTPERIDALLDPYTATRNRREVDMEGFPEMSPADFVAFFCKGHHCREDQIINRIEFKYL